MKGYLKAVEILGEMILEMQEEMKYKNIEIEHLKNQIKKLDGEKNDLKKSD